MKRLIILSIVIISSLGAPPHQTLSINEDGTYQFSYETGNAGGSHFRTESKGSDGTVIGKYSYQAPTGELRVVNYRADDTGFLASEDGEVPQPLASEIPVASEATAEDNQPDSQEKKETNPSSTTEAPDDDDEEEEKPLKLEEPIDDGPPEGFPPGFFSEQFSALRRLPEPMKEEKPIERSDGEKSDEPSTGVMPNIHWDPLAEYRAGLQPDNFPPGFFLHHFTGLRRLGEPVKLEESFQTIDGTKSDNPDNGATTEAQKSPFTGINSHHILPFPTFVPHMWPSSSHHRPVYVYSHQQPNGYTYGYYY